MRPERWREVEQLYHEALERPEGERSAFLQAACGGDDALRTAVESLLNAHQGAADFLEAPAVELAAPALAEVAAEVEADLVERLRVALADRYVIERELGHGGMARVYLAQDRKHQRSVAIKVLRPEVAATLGATRFLREIEIAAGLSHPHILPLYDSGEGGGFLYYVMPYVPGESLRDRLRRDRRLPLDDALRITREVADALAYAHSLGIVHRDIKPENILFTTGHALVSDFGIARAIAAAEGDKVTVTGIVVGTPAYMSPEQATGGELDARSDVYSLGCVWYEMLVGEPPFTGVSGLAVIAAQVTATPKSLLDLRRETPPVVAEAVARALAKDPRDRIQAAELRDTIAALPAAAGWRGHPLRVLGLYSLVAIAVFGAAYGLTVLLGLPGWVTSGATLLLLAGLPIMVATGVVERRRAVALATGVATPPRGRLFGWLTWRRALVGGGVAFAGLGVGTAGYMAMRLLGIGPPGTLIAAGVLKNREPLILADFVNRAADSTLGPSLTAAFRVDLSESPVVRVLDQTAIADALRRAERPATTTVDVRLARELAQRENVKAIVQGEIDPVGMGFVLSASLVAAADGYELTAVRETADNETALIQAVGRLSRQLRERIGESLRSIRASAQLAQVTTGSLEALRRYSEGRRAWAEADIDRAIAFFRDAVAIDTGFAMAYRDLAVLADLEGTFDTVVAMMTKAFTLRERLPELERDLVSAFYYSVYYDPTKVVASCRSALERDPQNLSALGHLALQYIALHQIKEAETLAVRATAIDTAHHWPLIVAQVEQGHFADAETTLAWSARVTSHVEIAWERANLASAAGDYARAEQAARVFRNAVRSNPLAEGPLAAIEAVQGRLSAAEQDWAGLMARNDLSAHLSNYFKGAITIAEIKLHFGDQAGALKTIAAALRRHPLSTLPPLERPYVGLSRAFARAGRTDEAARLLREYERTVPLAIRRGTMERYAAEGDILFARGLVMDAIARYQAWIDSSGADLLVYGEQSISEEKEGLFQIAQAYERAHRPDSALAYYERVVKEPAIVRLYGDQFVLASTLQRLGELYEARGDRALAREYYGRFVDLWKDADPELQPMVADARAALRRVSAEPR